MIVKNVSLNGTFHSIHALLRPLKSNHLVVLCTGIIEFEQTFIQRLAAVRAATMFQRGETNMLAYIEPETQEARRLHLIA